MRPRAMRVPAWAADAQPDVRWSVAVVASRAAGGGAGRGARDRGAAGADDVPGAAEGRTALARGVAGLGVLGEAVEGVAVVGDLGGVVVARGGADLGGVQAVGAGACGGGVGRPCRGAGAVAVRGGAAVGL